MRSDNDRLLDILEAIERIDKYSSQGKEAFIRDELIQTWIVHHLQVLGEAANKVSNEMKRDCPGIPWREIIAMRNILVHDYFTVDIDTIWVTIQSDLPRLKETLEEIIDKTT